MHWLVWIKSSESKCTVKQQNFKYTCLDAVHNTRVLPVHNHYNANDCNLSVLLLMFWKILVSSKLFIVYRSYVEPSSCSPPKLGSAKSWYLRSRSRNYLPPPQPPLLQSREIGKILISAWNFFNSRYQYKHRFLGSLKQHGRPTSGQLSKEESP